MSIGMVVATETWRNEIRDFLKDPDLRIVMDQSEVGKLQSFLDRIEQTRPDIVFLEVTHIKNSLSLVIEHIKATASSPQIVVLHSSAEPELILEAFRAGADEFLYPPFSASLPQTIKKLADALKDRRVTLRSSGKTLGFLSVKGGCGATTVACHVAAELRRQTGQKVLLADLDFAGGSVGFVMKAKSSYTILDALKNTSRLDLSYWTALISSCASELQVITSPGCRSWVEAPSEDQIESVLRFVRNEYDWTVIDLGAGLNPIIMNTLGQLDELFLLTTNEIPALHQAKQVVEKLVNNGLSRDKIRLVHNRAPKDTVITATELEQMLGVPLFTALPNDYDSLTEAYAVGQLLTRKSRLGSALAQLVGKLTDCEVQAGGGRKFGDLAREFLSRMRLGTAAPEIVREQA